MLTLFSFYPFSWCCTHSSMGPSVCCSSLIGVLRSAGFYDKSLASGMVCWEEYDVDGFFLLLLGYICGVFVFSNTL